MCDDLTRDGVGFHNVAELEPAPGGGVYLRRFPRVLREALSPLGRMVAQESAGAELRFVTEASSFRISLGCLPSVLAPYECHACDVFIFRGAFFHSHHRLNPNQINHINVVDITGNDVFNQITPEAARGCGFSHHVWRIFLGRYPAILLDVDTYGYEVRPPNATEVPARRWIAYGSSITHGAMPTAHHNAYIYHAARIASLDVCNLGLSGSCVCEPAMAAYLASRNDWDVMTLELGVNMRTSYTPAQFRLRAETLIRTIRSAHPQGQVALITTFPNGFSLAHARTSTHEQTSREQAFNAILREMAATAGTPKLTLIEGHEILDHFCSLTTDLVHPSDYGHAQMGMNLGSRLVSLFPAPRQPAVIECDVIGATHE